MMPMDKEGASPCCTVYCDGTAHESGAKIRHPGRCLFLSSSLCGRKIRAPGALVAFQVLGDNYMS
jgi:hypothetical protein